MVSSSNHTSEASRSRSAYINGSRTQAKTKTTNVATWSTPVSRRSGLLQGGQPPHELQFAATRLGGFLAVTLHLGEQATPVAGDHGVEVVYLRVGFWEFVRILGSHLDISAAFGARDNVLSEKKSSECKCVLSSLSWSARRESRLRVAAQERWRERRSRR